MTEWTDKPNAVIHAEVVTEEGMLDEIHAFCRDNPLPYWQFHPDMPPYPSRYGGSSFQFYWDRGNKIIVALDQDKMIWGMRVNSRTGERGLWLHVRTEIEAAHTDDGMTENSRQSVAHMEALSWALAGGIQPRFIPGEGANENVANLDHDANRLRNIKIYNSVYAPIYGLDPVPEDS